MSVKHILKAMEARVGNPSRKLVLIKLADNANDKGMCYPSYQHIADHCEMSKRSVIEHIKRLEKDGFLIKRRRHSDSGNQSNIYQLRFDSRGEDSAPPSEDSAPPSEKSAPGVVKNLHGGSENISPTPSENSAPRTSHSFEPVNEPREKGENKKRRNEFKPPTENELSRFAHEKNLNLSGMYDYYESIGWMVGKNKMRDWRAAARNWHKRQFEFSQQRRTANGRDTIDWNCKF